MIDVKKILFEISNDQKVFDPNYDLIENEIFDSLMFIELFTKFEELGINIQPTQIDRTLLRTSEGIQKIVDDYSKQKL